MKIFSIVLSHLFLIFIGMHSAASVTNAGCNILDADQVSDCLDDETFILRLWTPHLAQAQVGHITLEVKGMQLSVWPKQGKSDTSHFFTESVPAKLLATYYHDRLTEGRECDHYTVYATSPSRVKAMKQFIALLAQNVAKEQVGYRIHIKRLGGTAAHPNSTNCANSVYRAIQPTALDPEKNSMFEEDDARGNEAVAWCSNIFNQVVPADIRSTLCSILPSQVQGTLDSIARFGIAAQKELGLPYSPAGIYDDPNISVYSEMLYDSRALNTFDKWHQYKKAKEAHEPFVSRVVIKHKNTGHFLNLKDRFRMMSRSETMLATRLGPTTFKLRIEGMKALCVGFASNGSCIFRLEDALQSEQVEFRLEQQATCEGVWGTLSRALCSRFLRPRKSAAEYNIHALIDGNLFCLTRESSTTSLQPCTQNGKKSADQRWLVNFSG